MHYISYSMSGTHQLKEKVGISEINWPSLLEFYMLFGEQQLSRKGSPFIYKTTKVPTSSSVVHACITNFSKMCAEFVDNLCLMYNSKTVAEGDKERAGWIQFIQ